MNRLACYHQPLRLGLGLALLAGAFYFLSLSPVSGEDTKAPTGKTPAAKPAEAKPGAKKKLSGAELYAVHCNRCHPERYPTEWRSGEWKTIMTHMRVRANLPASQAKEILKYLQDESGN
jgi:mono/diheme cytochrome c family protein